MIGQGEIRAMRERLEALELSTDTDSHERLAAIASAIYQPMMGWTAGACEALRAELMAILEAALEWETAGLDAMTDGELAEAGLMRLPKDKDGEVIHMGDVMAYADNTKPMEVVALVPPAVFLTEDGPRYADMCRHYHRPTVEDVLMDACKAYHSLMVESMSDVAHDMPAPSEVIADYATKLRLREES